MNHRTQAEGEASTALSISLEELEAAGVGEGALHHVVRTLSVAWLKSALSGTDAVAGSDGRVELEVSGLDAETFLVRGQLRAGFVVPCARCLTDAQVSADGELCWRFVPARRLEKGDRRAEDEEGIELDAGELDEVGYTGPALLIGEALAEAVRIAYPMRALCSLGEACLGLCSSCGRNLNEPPSAETPSDCECMGQADEGDEPDSPWKRALSKAIDKG